MSIDVHGALLKALTARLEDDRHALATEQSRSRAWASGIFSGARHRYALRLSGPDCTGRLDRFTAALEAAEFDLPGHLVADIGITERREETGESHLVLEALTLEDA